MVCEGEMLLLLERCWVVEMIFGEGVLGYAYSSFSWSLSFTSVSCFLGGGVG